MLTAAFSWIPDGLDELQRQGLIRRRRVFTPLADGWCEINGRRLRNFAANDYLNLAHDPRVIAAAENAAREGGAGASASALVTGRTPWHAELEERLAQFENQPAAILFPTGFAANVGTITALVGAGDVIFSDRLNHASIVDGCRLSGAKIVLYEHDDLSKLEDALRDAGKFRRRLIVSDSVFSMDGDLAPLPVLCELAEKYGAMLVIDEAHATGVFGAHGRGVAELQGVEHRSLIRVGTLSKAIGSQGGFVAGSQELIDWFWNRARPQMFSTALTPAACAAATAALDIVETEPWRRERLQELATAFEGWTAPTTRGESTSQCPTMVGAAHPTSPIIPVILNTPERATQVAARLEDSGYLVAAIRPPTVPQGTSRLRITLTCGHTVADVQALVRELKESIIE